MLSVLSKRIVAAGLAVVAAILVISYVLGGAYGEIAALVYLLGILIPGGAVYGALSVRLREGKTGLLDAVFFSNLVGLALLIGASWLLARSGVFSLAGVAGLEGLAVAVALAFSWRHLVRVWRKGLGDRFAVTREEAVYLGLIAAFGTAMMAPVLVLFAQGFLVGGDTPIFAYVASVTAHTGAWPNLSQIWYPYASQGAMAPGAPMIYAVFSAAEGGGVVMPLTTPLSIVPVVLLPIGLCLLLRRFSDRMLVVYVLPVVWMACGSGQLFPNSLFAGVSSGVFPDFIWSLPAFVAALIVLTDFLCGKGSQWWEVFLLASSILLVSLLNQLTFLFLAVAIILFGIQILWVRGVRWALLRAAASVVPSVVLFPLYFVPSYARSTSPAASGGPPITWGVATSFSWDGLLKQFAPLLPSITVFIVALALGIVLYREIRALTAARRGAPPLPPRGVVVLTAIGAIAVYLTFTQVGANLLGINSGRFIEFNGLVWLPVVGFALDWLLKLGLPKAATSRLPRLGRKAVAPAVALLVALLLVSSAVVGVQANLNSEQQLSGPQDLFTPNMLAAADWLAGHAPPGAILVADENSGNGALEAIRDYSGHELVSRPRDVLYESIYQTPYPANLSYYYANLVMTSPTTANAAAASAALGMDYYIFQIGFSDDEIQAFSLLPYFDLVYSNPQIDVFEYVGGSTIGFVPAVSYCSASPSITATHTRGAYDDPFGLPNAPNSVSSTNNSPPPTTNVSYCLHAPSSGNYTLYVHRIVLKTVEFLNVSVNGQPQGDVYFSTLGPSLGSPLNLSLSGGNVTLTLSFEDTLRWIDPVDYLVVGAL